MEPQGQLLSRQSMLASKTSAELSPSRLTGAGLPVRYAVPETPGFIAQAAQVRLLCNAEPACAALCRAALGNCLLCAASTFF